MRATVSRLSAAVCAVMLFATVSQAQVAGLDIGVTAGVNLATLSEGDGDTKNLTGFMVGVSFIHRMTDMFAFQPEIAYSMKGAKFDDGVDEGELKLAYIDVPLLAKISFGPAMAMGQARPAFYVGPYAAFNLSCEIESGSVSVDCDDPLLDAEPKTVDFGGIAGVGLDVGNLNIFARYQFGLTSVFDDDDSKNRVIQIGGRFSFRGR